MLGWLTPDEVPAQCLCRVLYIPDDFLIYANVLGALLELTDARNWEQFGDVTPEAAASAMQNMFDEFVESNCVNEPAIVFVSDVKTQNTDGGTATAGSWQTRTLNSLDDVNGVGAELSSNAFTLPAGKWLIEWSAPAFRIAHHQTRLWSVSENQSVVVGTTEMSNSDAAFQTRSFGHTVQNNSVATTYRIEHRVGTSRTTNGYGSAANFASEVYTLVKCTALSLLTD